MMKFEIYAPCNGSCDSWCIWLQWSKTDEGVALGRWLELVAKLKVDPSERNLQMPLMHILWTAAIWKLLAMEKSKQMEILIQGRWSNKNFVKWWRIDEVSMNLVDEGSWWIFTFGGKNSYKLLWNCDSDPNSVMIKLLYFHLITLLIMN